MAKVEIYITPKDPYCLMTMKLFDNKSVAYERYDVSADRAKQAWLKEVTGQTTLPQVFIDGVSYGGYNEISILDREGKLNILLRIV